MFELFLFILFPFGIWLWVLHIKQIKPPYMSTAFASCLVIGPTFAIPIAIVVIAPYIFFGGDPNGSEKKLISTVAMAFAGFIFMIGEQYLKGDPAH